MKDLKEVTITNSNKNLEYRVLYKFKDGCYIANLLPEELKAEGILMSNCIKERNYFISVSKKEFAILALKDKNDKTLVHFQVANNGALIQNFEKANNNVRLKHWKHIVKFFKQNSKHIDLKSIEKEMGSEFNFFWVANFYDSEIHVRCMLPNKIIKKVTKEGIKTTIDGNHQIKTFCLANLMDKSTPTEVSGSKEDIIFHISLLKEAISKKLDNFISQIKMTNGGDLYLSDNMKEKIFGKQYTLKGDKYNIIDLEPKYMVGGVIVRDGHVDGPAGAAEARILIGVDEEVNDAPRDMELPRAIEDIPLGENELMVEAPNMARNYGLNGPMNRRRVEQFQVQERAQDPAI